MLLAVFGAVLLVLGLFAGAALVVAPLGLAAWSTGPVLWLLFPVFSVLGYVLFVIGARSASIRWLSLAASCLLLLLALASAAGLVLDAASVLKPVASTVSLWYVFIVAGLVGAVGAARGGDAAPPAAARSSP
jgi:hypothetical protein